MSEFRRVNGWPKKDDFTVIHEESGRYASWSVTGWTGSDETKWRVVEQELKREMEPEEIRFDQLPGIGVMMEVKVLPPVAPEGDRAELVFDTAEVRRQTRRERLRPTPGTRADGAVMPPVPQPILEGRGWYGGLPGRLDPYSGHPRPYHPRPMAMEPPVRDEPEDDRTKLQPRPAPHNEHGEARGADESDTRDGGPEKRYDPKLDITDRWYPR